MLLSARNDKLFIALLLAVIALAWLGLWVWGQSPYARFLDHEALTEVNGEDVALLVFFVAGWTLMFFVAAFLLLNYQQVFSEQHFPLIVLSHICQNLGVVVLANRYVQVGQHHAFHPSISSDLEKSNKQNRWQP